VLSNVSRSGLIDQKKSGTQLDWTIKRLDPQLQLHQSSETIGCSLLLLCHLTQLAKNQLQLVSHSTAWNTSEIKDVDVKEYKDLLIADAEKARLVDELLSDYC
jgi:hypothetical protein